MASSSSSSKLALIAFLLIATTSFSQPIIPFPFPFRPPPPPPANLPPVVGPPILNTPPLVDPPPTLQPPLVVPADKVVKIIGVVGCTSEPQPTQRLIGPRTVTLSCDGGRTAAFPPVRASDNGVFGFFLSRDAARGIDLSRCALFTRARGADCPALNAGEVFRAELGQSFTPPSGSCVVILVGRLVRVRV